MRRYNLPYNRIRLEVLYTVDRKTLTVGSISVALNPLEMDYRSFVEKVFSSFDIPVTDEVRAKIVKTEEKLKTMSPEVKVVNRLETKIRASQKRATAKVTRPKRGKAEGRRSRVAGL